MFGGWFAGRRVLVTGHTGFKGSWLSIWLELLGARVTGFSLPGAASSSHFDQLGLGRLVEDLRGDVREPGAVAAAIERTRPAVILHLAGQALLSVAHREPAETVATNVMGTVQVLEAARRCAETRAVVVVTSDKVYQEGGAGTWGCREEDPLGGDELYAASKAAADLVSLAYARRHFTAPLAGVATARAGNVIGGGDWSERRLVPDCVRAWTRGDEVVLRRPEATRPWQHVLEPLAAYLNLARLLATQRTELHGRGFNIGPRRGQNATVEALVSALSDGWPGARWRAAGTPDEIDEVARLQLDSLRSEQLLGWNAILPLEEAAAQTIEWYRAAVEGSAEGEGGAALLARTRACIHGYHQRALAAGVAWARQG